MSLRFTTNNIIGFQQCITVEALNVGLKEKDLLYKEIKILLNPG